MHPSDEAVFMLFYGVKASGVGSGLFDARDDGQLAAGMRALDGLNLRFGRDTLTFGGNGRPRAWRLRSGMLSQRYTTEWNELLTAL
jgi:DNA polymerase V